MPKRVGVEIIVCIGVYGVVQNLLVNKWCY
jgi:hypothetical protein